ncbi:retrotransposon protein, putative, ty1-copia subclass [Tanacetum coccineum]
MQASRSIYGLKQASRSWNKRFDEEIKRFGFTQNLDEPCVYQKASGSNVTFLILYVDDIIIMGNHIPSLQKDRSKRLIGLCQNAYMDKILKEIYEWIMPKRSLCFAGKKVTGLLAKNILKYLRNTKDMFLVYGGNRKLNFELIAMAL